MKLLFLIFPVNDPYLNTIHEKDFLYGRKNFQYIYNSYGGDLSYDINTSSDILSEGLNVTNNLASLSDFLGDCKTGFD